MWLMLGKFSVQAAIPSLSRQTWYGLKRIGYQGSLYYLNTQPRQFQERGGSGSLEKLYF